MLFQTGSKYAILITTFGIDFIREVLFFLSPLLELPIPIWTILTGENKDFLSYKKCIPVFRVDVHVGVICNELAGVGTARANRCQK